MEKQERKSDCQHQVDVCAVQFLFNDTGCTPLLLDGNVSAAGAISADGVAVSGISVCPVQGCIWQ